MQVTPQPAIRSTSSFPNTSTTREPLPLASATGKRFTTGRKCADSRARIASKSIVSSVGHESGTILASMRDVILLQGIQVPAALGVTAAERRMRRPVLLDLEIARDLREAGRSDSIRHTIHYKRIFEIVEDVAGNQQHKLV